MANLKLEFLGNVHSFLGEELLEGFRTKKVQALLIYLAVEMEAQDRDSLTTLLWPGMPERSARANLRQVLYYLRQTIPELDEADGQEKMVQPLFVNRQSIQLNPEADIIVDVQQFESHLVNSRTHNHFDLLSCPTCHDDLQQAAELYRGHFLADFYLEDSNPFEEWALENREALRRQVLDALDTLTTMHARQREYAEALIYANRQIEIDNLREPAYRQLMEIMALNGQRSEAAAVYEKCRRLFAEELGMEPSKRTTELYEQILAGDLNFEPGLSREVRGYDLQEEIGEGNYGSIHRAIQPSINREVAIKVIRRKYANNPEFIRRFEFEAETIAHLEHPHIVPLYDYWRDPDGAYLVMRYLKGGNLLDALKTGPWETAAAADTLDQVAAALNAAHKQGIVHRDIKPANILLDEEGNAYLSDFGIAKDAKVAMQITAAGAMIGTPDYISPEQILNDPVTPQADIYSLGAVLFEMLSGERPFADATVANLFYKHLREPIPLLEESQPDLPPQIDEVIQRATAKNPADRYATALEMAAAFRAAIQGHSGQAFEPAIIPVVDELYNPYKGLRAFQEADADDFFGREALIKNLLKRLDSEDQFLALVGPSGSGKSSVVKAGLIPELRAGALSGSKNWFVTDMVPGTHPLEELELALWPVAVDPPPSLVEPMARDTRGMLRTMRRILPEGPDSQLLLIIDQFEELFTMVEDEERRAFFIDSLLLALSAPRSPLRVIITLRADFYDRPLQYEMLGRLIKHNTEVILPLTSEELSWAVREPARRMGVSVEEGLAETIVSDVADQPGALPLLQYALTELFERRQENGRVMMSKNEYKAIGGVHGALGRKAEEIFDSLGADEQAAAQQMFLRLVTLGEGVEDTRRRVRRSELEDINNQQLTGNGKQKTENGAVMSPVIDAFGAARLLTFDRDPQTRQATVEVAHEALLREWPRLRGWLDEDRNDVRMQRMLAGYAREWSQSQRREGFLMRGARLDQFAGWAATSTIALTGEEADFLQQSIAARQAREAAEEARQQRELETAQKLAQTERERAEEQAQAASSLRKRAAFLAGALIIAALLAVAAIFFARQSSQNAVTAEQNAAEAGQNAALAVTREAEALAEASARSTAQALAESNEGEAVAQRATAEAEANFRATAEAQAVLEREAAEEQARIAFARELAASAQESMEEDPERSILLAMHGLSVAEIKETEEALREALQASRVRYTLPIPDGLSPPWGRFNPDGSLLFTSGIGGGVMWDMRAEPTLLYTVTIPGLDQYPEGFITESWINRSDFNSDGSMIAMPTELWAGDEFVEDSGKVLILDSQSGEELLSFVAHDFLVQEVVFSPDDRLLATAGFDMSATIWDLEASMEAGEGVPRATISQEDTITGVAFSPDGQLLATAAGEAGVAVWDAATGENIQTMDPETVTTYVAFSPDGQYITSAGFDGNITVWDPLTGELVDRKVNAHASTIQSTSFNSDGTQLASTGLDRQVQIWRFADGRIGENLLTLSGGHSDVIGQAPFSPDGQTLVSVSRDAVRVWDISDTGEKEVAIFEQGGGVPGLSLSPDGRRLVTSGGNGLAKVWDLAMEELSMTLTGHEDTVFESLYSPDGKLIATASRDGTIRFWDAQTGQENRVIEAHELTDGFFSGATDIEFLADGQQIVSAGADGLVKVWDVDSGKLLQTLVGHDDAVARLAVSTDGRFVASASDDHKVNIWRVGDGQLVSTLTGPDEAQGVDISPQGDHLVVGYTNGEVILYSLDLTSSSDDIEEPRILWRVVHDSSYALDAHFSPDGRLIAAPSLRRVALWDVDSGELVIDLSHPQGALKALFNADGSQVITGGTDGFARIFAVGLDNLLALAQSRVTRSLSEDECRQYLHVEQCPAAE